MFKYILRRIIQAIPTMVGISIISFAIMAAAPGGPTAAMKLDPKSTLQQREQAAERLGINDPVHIQYLRWMIGDAPIIIDDIHIYKSIKIPLPKITIWGGRVLPIFDRSGNELGTEVGTQKGILRGDFGRSFTYKRPVDSLIKEKMGPTAELGAASLLVGFGVGVPLGILAALGQGGTFDNFTRIMAVIFNAVPAFWLGLLLILIFGSELGLLPMGNRCPISVSGECSLTDRAERMILPVFTLATGFIAVLSRYSRAATLDVLNQDYVRTARAKGLRANQVSFTHVGRNTLIPIVTLLGPSIPGILGGAVVVERIFSWQGLGRLALEAVTTQDYPVVMAFVMFGGISTVLGYLLSDILYAVVDPRISLSSGGPSQ